MIIRRFCFACDLKDHPKLIEEYKNHHLSVNAWPEVTQSIKEAGVVDMEIHLLADRLFMIMDVDETFDLQRKSNMDAKNPKVQEWEKLMWEFQKPLPGAKKGEKWMLMEQIFKL